MPTMTDLVLVTWLLTKQGALKILSGLQMYELGVQYQLYQLY